MKAEFLIKEVSSKEEKSEKETKSDVQNYTALCVNCDERANCKIRNNTSAIWHCEEYK
ncbi:MAG: hypothetical protein JEZ09_09275 [Salinivirgaceae bacterium]|nr:hypothetical protein [Salinivirgaceae bacterium]